MKKLQWCLALVFSILLLNEASAQEKPKRQPARNIKITRDVEYGRAGDRSLKLDIYQPNKPSSELLPVIVWIHGGGWRGGNKSSGGRIRPFVQSGKYVGVSVGYRLSGEAKWPAQIHDCKAAIRWVRANASKYGIDKDRIGLWGSSAGGHLVSLLGTSSDIKELEGKNGSPDATTNVKCVVDYCGPTDLTVFKHGALDQLFGKPFKERQAEAKAASPANYVTKDDPPILIVHGTKDNVVPISQAQLFYDKLKKAGVDVTFVKMENGGHGIGGKEIMERVTDFFAKHLQGKKVKVSGETIKVK